MSNETVKYEQTSNETNYKTVIALKLHNILAENGIEAVKTEINRNDPSKIVWKYLPSAKFYELLREYVQKSRATKAEK